MQTSALLRLAIGVLGTKPMEDGGGVGDAEGLSCTNGCAGVLPVPPRDHEPRSNFTASAEACGGISRGTGQ